MVHLFGHFHFIGTEFNIAFSYVAGYIILNKIKTGVTSWNSES